MNFIENLKNTLEEEFNESVTENGAVGYKTTGKEILDFNFKIASYRNKSEDEIIKDFMKVFLDNKVLAIQFLFFIRDREEGLGERRLFRVIFRHLAITESELIKKVIPVVAEYGRYDDLFELFETPLEEDMLKYITTQWNKDVLDMEKGKNISLLTKWLPSINASPKKKKQAKKIIAYLNLECNDTENEIKEKDYRKALSLMRRYLDVVEKKMCANEWDKIKYENVPSRANLNYNDAFLRHDEERRREFLGQVKSGEKKINAGKLYPHDIVSKYCEQRKYSWRRTISTSVDVTLEELWKALPKKDIANTLVVADGSGSMTSTIGNTNIRALDIANALAIYFAEHNKGEFKDQYITFSETPQLVSFKGITTLRDKIQKALLYDEVANTNIEKVFKLILTTAVKHNLKQEEMPKNILIISDMEFDDCVETDAGSPNEKLFNIFKNKYKEYGYALPRIVFWNVSSRTGAIPLKENELGVALVSGFSTNIAEMVMSDKLDPLEVLLDKLNKPRYKKIAEMLEN